jgi:hypothetical protein
MRDRRVQIFRSAAMALVESLDAVVRLSRWTGADAAPEPLVSSAAKIVERLGAADRLVGSRYDGPKADADRVAAMCEAMKRLDVAYRAYRQKAEGSGADATAAAVALECEVAAVDAGAWQ